MRLRTHCKILFWNKNEKEQKYRIELSAEMPD